MKKIALIGVACACLAATPSRAMSEAECTAAWDKADTKKAGVLTEAEARRYYAAVRVANKTLPDGKLTKAEFLTHCKAGLFDSRAADTGAPLKGANSFTEGQAKDRAVAHGLTDVGELKKDADGIWRGTAKHDGKTVNVAVDFKGNVVTSQ